MTTPPILNVADIQAEAEARAGVKDPELSRFGENLAALVDFINAESALSAAGCAATRETLVSELTHRLQGLDWIARHPEIKDEVIDRPIFLMGLPRSGTTFFQYLFDRDHRFRQIRTWEASEPSPPPSADADSARRRLELAVERHQQLLAEVEGFAAIHLFDPDGAQECHMFLSQTFAAAGFHNTMTVPSYFDYLMDELDLVGAYEVHRRQLQLLQWGSPRPRWALKYPNHVIGMPAIAEVYPDASMVMTHRDPVQTLASISKLSYVFRGQTSDAVERKVAGQHMLHFVQRHIDRIMEFDATPDGRRVVHVDYYRLIDDPAKVMGEVHAGLDLDTPAEVRRAVADWHRDNPKGARGSNPYALEEYGLNADAVAEQFADYMRRFDVPRERAGLERRA